MSDAPERDDVIVLAKPWILREEAPDPPRPPPPIFDETITDEEFMNHESQPTFRDFSVRRNIKALRAWGRPLGITDSILEEFADLSPMTVRTFINDPVDCICIGLNPTKHDIVALERGYWDAFSEADLVRWYRCTKCARATTNTADSAFVRQFCDECYDEWQARPSTPPENGIRAALARARGAKLPATLTAEQWDETVAHFRDRCAFCGGPWAVVEHATPIIHGGGSTWDNCLPACHSCNIRKASRSIEELIGFRWESFRERIELAVGWLRSHGRARTKIRFPRKDK